MKINKYLKPPPGPLESEDITVVGVATTNCKSLSHLSIIIYVYVYTYKIIYDYIYIHTSDFPTLEPPQINNFREPVLFEGNVLDAKLHKTQGFHICMDTGRILGIQVGYPPEIYINLHKFTIDTINDGFLLSNMGLPMGIYLKFRGVM